MTTLDFGIAETGVWTPQSAFHQIVHPALAAAGMLPRGKLTHTEGTSQDHKAGIDWIISGADGTQTSIAARVRWVMDYGNFTIRYRTERGTMSELTKRYKSVMAGGTYPTLTVDAFVDKPNGTIINAYVIRSDILYPHFVRSVDEDTDRFTLCGCAGRPRMAPGGAQFIPVAISEFGKVRGGTKSTLIACGIPVQSFRPIDEGHGLWGG